MTLINRRLIGFAGSLLMVLTPLPLRAKKAYEGAYLKVTRTWTNRNGLRIIEGNGGRFDFVLTCTPKADEHCTAPSVSSAYFLYAPSKEVYYGACDNYLLGSSSIETGGMPVCLDSVEPTP